MIDELKFAAFVARARSICHGNEEHLAVLAALEQLVRSDPEPYEQIITKLVTLSGQSRKLVSGFIRAMRGC